MDTSCTYTSPGGSLHALKSRSIFLVPTSSAPLTQIHIGGDNLLLLYRDGRARLWDSKTQEFWRSMNTDRTDEMLKQGGWTSWYMLDVVSRSGSTNRTVQVYRTLNAN